MSGLTFLSWARVGPQLDASVTDPLTGPLPAHGALRIGVRLNERAEVQLPARLYGPGDVTGLDPRQVIRTDPASGVDSAEPSFFPLIEFDAPHLPWLLTPAQAQDGERLRPWLVLVVVEAGIGKVGPEPGAPLPVLRCPRRELPNLDESWAWAHVQLATDGDLEAGTLDGLLSGPPERSLSRLLCPRRLRAGARYIACVVPAFEAGRKRGLGIPLNAADEAALAPAWTAGANDDEIALPAYYHWTFGTGLEGDFEALVRRLRARPAPGNLGQRPLDVSHAGPGFPAIDPADPAAVVNLVGALRGAKTPSSPWDPDAAAAFADALTPLLAQRPGRLGPPLYGGGHAGVGNVVDGPQWLRELNLDPRHRVAAAYGAEIIRRHQEALMASAWSQAAAVARVNDALRQGQLARMAGTSAYERRLLGGTALDQQRLLQVSAPAHAALTETTPLGGNREVQAAVSPAFRRLTRPGGPLARRIATDGPLEPPVEALATRDLTVNPLLKPAPGMVALEHLTGSDRVRDLTASRVQPRWWEKTDPLPSETRTPVTPRVLSVGAAMPNRVFMVAEDGRVLSRVDDPAAWHDHGFPPGSIATSQPVALRDLYAFVRTADGRLCSLHWDGDRWLWEDHGMPEGNPITGRPVAIARNTQSSTNDDVYVCAGGNLWELHHVAHWRVIEPPPNTVIPVHGVPSVADGDNLFVHGLNGHLYCCYKDGSTWVWEDWGCPADKGFPDVVIDPMVPPLVQGTPPLVPAFVRTTSGQIFVRYPFFGGLWGPFSPTGENISGILGWYSGMWVTSASSGRVWRYWTPPDATDPVWEPIGPVGGLRALGVVRNGEPWIAADGKLLVLRVGASYTWNDFGLPTSSGAGADDALPPMRPAWRGMLGFMSNLLVAHVDMPGGDNVAHLRIGRDLGFEGEVRGGWEQKPGITGIGDHPEGAGQEPQGVGIALWDLDGSGRQDIVLFWVEDLTLGYFGSWRIGRNVGPDGAADWSGPVKRMPTPMSTQFGSSGSGLTAAYPVLAADITLGDLDGDERPEMIAAYVSGIPNQERLFYRIGWRVDAAGDVTGGWTESIEVPWPGRVPGGMPVRGVGVALADINNDLRPELVVLLLEWTPSGLRASYMIGWDINARGHVIGGWTGPHEVGGGPLGQDAQGASIAIADFSGSQLPDLVVFHLENLAGQNRAFYRVGFDLQSSGLPRRWSEPREVHAGGYWGAESLGAGIAVGDLDNALLDRKRQFGSEFRAAARLHQQLIERGQALARADDQAQLELSSIAEGVRAALEPDRTVTQRVTDRIEGVDFDQLPDGADRLNPLAVAPTFPQAMSQPLAELSQDLLLSGRGDVPPDTITLVRANTAFIEAYMVGLNHEFARELLWREFPGDRRATFFRQFWDARAGDPDEGPLTDIPPIHEWASDKELGGHATGVGGPEMVVLIVRGELLHRYPNASVFARRAAWPGGDLSAPRVLGTEILLPQFQAHLPPDQVLFGFPLTVDKARGVDGDPGWFFVLAENPTAPRFGIDDPPEDAAYGAAPASWEELDWAALAQDEAGLAALRHAPVRAAPWGGVTRPTRRDGGDPQATWARNSAHLAHITLQRSVLVAVHATDMLPEFENDGDQPTNPSSFAVVRDA
ncbi:hypothetical protein [Polyangium jinanense]|uniref:Uncharacterized protein n=1 Tax=Polyangium jinanense TaxID=2829994 RepID=A0A9X3X556_9BACT|nr:hypothetical protein [Polyangium jinanense]MDC3984477.1 hypothetical protein [Polyangium jinanense]